MISIATRGMIQGATAYCLETSTGQQVSPCSKQEHIIIDSDNPSSPIVRVYAGNNPSLQGSSEYSAVAVPAPAPSTPAPSTPGTTTYSGITPPTPE